MGCTSSTATNEQYLSSPDIDEYIRVPQGVEDNKINRTNETILQAYQRMDEEICSTEQSCPGPRLATAEAWIDHLESLEPELILADDLITGTILQQQQRADENSMGNFATGIKPNEDNDDVEVIQQMVVADGNEREKENEDVIKLTLQLGVVFDVEKATKHEEFLAKVSRNVMALALNHLRFEMIEHSRKRAANLMESYNKLRYLYSEQDALVSSVSGGNYLTSLEEKLDGELENARQIRDKLGSVAEQWRTSGTLIRASERAATQAAEYWKLVGPSKNASERVSHALDSRSCILHSLAAFEGAQSALPQVEIPFVSPRQVSAVQHANVYLLTDMANDARYRHTQRVFEAYQVNVKKGMEWLQETYKKTLKKDLDTAEDTVLTIAKRLRQERVRNFSEIVGSRLYNSPNAGPVR